MTTAAALVIVVLGGIVAAFQLALAAGAPWGAAAWGGRHAGVLTPRLRAMSLATGLLLYPYLMAAAAAAAGLGPLAGEPGPPAMRTMWIFAGIFAFGTLTNALSPSRPERWWAPVAAALAAAWAVLAAS